MGEIAKWAILVAGAIIIIGLIVAFPIVEYIDGVALVEGILTIVNILGDGLVFGRGLINNLLSPFGRIVISGLMMWFIGKWVITMTLKITVWAYKFIFK